LREGVHRPSGAGQSVFVGLGLAALAAAVALGHLGAGAPGVKAAARTGSLAMAIVGFRPLSTAYLAITIYRRLRGLRNLEVARRQR
jgi:hypothetical protein